MRKGCTGNAVRDLQEELIRRGYDCGFSGADGIFGKNTEAALKRFQQDHGLAADGICGPLTYAALEEKTETQLYTVHIPMLPLYKAEALVNAYSGAWMTKEGRCHL
ncbi:MAG: peptidoglycan-binding protein [Clostridia bacterium]|nr:peptidoglycan-binding protein [Clostridia bacterium]